MGAKVLFLNEFQRIINISLFSDHNVNFPIRFFYSVYFSNIPDEAFQFVVL